MTKRKLLVLSRHGKAPKKEDGITSMDQLLPESIRSVYENARGSLNPFVSEQGVSLRNTLLRHSDKKRTVYTGEAIILGAFALAPIPGTQEELATYNLSSVDRKVDPRLSYIGIKLNMEAIKREGVHDYLSRWMANPDATEYDGVPVTSFNDLMRGRRECLVDTLGKLLNQGEEGKDLGVLVSHGAIVEALMIAAVNSARPDIGVEGLDDIGGEFDMEDNAILTIEQREKSGSYEARLDRKGQNYNVDLENLSA